MALPLASVATAGAGAAALSASESIGLVDRFFLDRVRDLTRMESHVESSVSKELS
jgi:hypothetical protein